MSDAFTDHRGETPNPKAETMAQVIKGRLKPRCNDLFLKVYKLVPKQPGCYEAFAVGNLAGLAEKVYLGACSAAMVAPLHQDFTWVWPIAKKVARIYGLKTLKHKRKHRTEIWLCSHELYDYDNRRMEVVDFLRQHIDDNLIRGTLCGILDIDFGYELEAPIRDA